MWLRRGQELWLLVHIEVQAKPEANFAERMLVYHLRIFDRFHSHATSLAILCDSNTKWRPQQYHVQTLETEVLFRFGMVKLLDYRDRWAELEQSGNPFAIVVMAHLQAQTTQRAAKRRQEWKLDLVRRLYEKGFERLAIVNLFRFIDWVMILPSGLEQEFWQTLKAYEEERRMPYLSSIERMGLQQGLQQGAQQEARAIILRQLARRVGILSDSARAQIGELTLVQLELLGDALLDFSHPSDLETWLSNQTESSSLG